MGVTSVEMMKPSSVKSLASSSSVRSSWIVSTRPASVSTGGKGRAIRPSGKLDARSGQGRMQLCRFGPDRLRCPIKPPGNQADMHVF